MQNFSEHTVRANLNSIDHSAGTRAKTKELAYDLLHSSSVRRQFVTVWTYLENARAMEC